MPASDKQRKFGDQPFGRRRPAENQVEFDGRIREARGTKVGDTWVRRFDNKRFTVEKLNDELIHLESNGIHATENLRSLVAQYFQINKNHNI